MVHLKLKMIFIHFFGLFYFLVFTSEALARAGGGGNHGGGLLSLILAPFFIAYAWYVNRKINEKKWKTDDLLKEISIKDPEWDEEHLEEIVRKKFLEIEKGWCEQDLTSLQNLLRSDLFSEWKIQLEAMRNKGQHNVMDDLSLNDVRVVEVKNYHDRDKDTFTACLDASATDYTVDALGVVVGSNTASRRKKANNEKSNEKFREFWTFQRDKKDWLLLRVDQGDQWKKTVNEPLVNED